MKRTLEILRIIATLAFVFTIAFSSVSQAWAK